MAFKIKNVCNKPSLGLLQTLEALEGFEGEFRKSWSVLTPLVQISNYTTSSGSCSVAITGMARR